MNHAHYLETSTIVPFSRHLGKSYFRSRTYDFTSPKKRGINTAGEAGDVFSRPSYDSPAAGGDTTRVYPVNDR